VTFKYLGFILNNKGKEHIKELCGKGRAARKVWGLGKKLCRNDFRRRWILFRYLIQCYGIWGRNMRMGRKRGIRKDNDGLCKMVIWFRILYT